MRFAKTLGVVALAGTAFADDCSKDIEISDANAAISCKTVKGSITVKSGVSGTLVIDGPETIQGDLVIKNITGLISISSTTISSIQGTFSLEDLEGLSTINFNSLDTINELSMIKVPELKDLTFGSEGVTKATKVSVINTRLESLSGLKLSTVDSFTITNNQRMTQFDSELTNVTTELIINSNGQDMQIQMKKLKNAKEIQIGNVKSFTAPLLKGVTGSIKFDKNDELTSFLAPNLTDVTDAVSFINNKKLSNVSFPLLTSIGGDLTFVNNTEVKEVNGFPALEDVGSINFGGNFESVDLPKIDRVKGAALVTSTTDIGDFCKYFDKLKSNNKIAGKESCTSNNKDAVTGGKGGNNANSTDSNDDKKDAAGSVNVNFAVLGLALVAGAAQLL